MNEEIVPVYGRSIFRTPSPPTSARAANQTMEALGKLKPVFDRRDGTVTVGNSCQGHRRRRRPFSSPMPRLHTITMSKCSATWRAYAYCRPRSRPQWDLAPFFAIDQLLTNTGLSVADIDLWEINEAFAAQVFSVSHGDELPKIRRREIWIVPKPIGEIPLDKLKRQRRRRSRWAIPLVQPALV